MNKIPLNIFSKSYVTRIQKDVQDNNSIGLYELDNYAYEENYPRGNSLIMIPDNFELILPTSTRDHYDLENSINLFNALENVNETQATDPRLWTFLTHGKFWTYMRKRWPVELKNNKVDFILERYFITTINTRSFLRNGIARLWWYSKLTFDKKREDPFELTKTLLKDQDLVQSILERNLGLNKNILTGYLEYIQDKNLFGSDTARELRRQAAEFLNLSGGVRILPSFSKNEIKDILNQYFD